VAALVAAGHSGAELRENIAGCDFEALKDGGWEGPLPRFARIVRVLKNRGIYEGKVFLNLMERLLEAKGVRTFGDLVRRPEADLRYRTSYRS
jgi:hypothetical protein